MNVVLQDFSLCRDVPPGSPNPDSISDQKCHFPQSVSNSHISICPYSCGGELKR